MIHQYKNNGYNIVLDVNSGSVHVVDDVVYDLIPIAEELLQDKSEEQVKAACLERLQEKYEAADIEDAYEQVMELKEMGQLYAPDIYEN